jgi:hypothetical protein
MVMLQQAVSGKGIQSPPSGMTLLPGTPVEVRTRFDGGWCTGFAIAEIVTARELSSDRSYRLRRTSDGAVLPRLFSVDDIVPSQRCVGPDPLQPRR